MATVPSSLDSPNLFQRRRKSQVFVEIPPSPLFKARVATTSSKVDDLSAFHKSESHKENAAPLSTKTSINNIPIEMKTNGKRKVQDDEVQTPKPATKKAKILDSNDNDILIACHQCRSKKQPSLALQCTCISARTGSRCKASYCDTCLKNRYGEDLNVISHRKVPESREGHADTDYHFICPRCNGNCNCAPCRRRRGLVPVGKFTLAQGGESVREILEKNPQASGLLPKNTAMPVPKAQKSAKATVPTKATDDSTKGKGTAKVSRQKRNTVGEAGKKSELKPVPEPIWVSIPRAGTKQDIEGRIYLREFILRFNPILNIGVRNIDELDDFTSLHDQSARAILLALLDLIAVEDEAQKKRIQTKIKTIRGLGLNWGKVVPVLYDLRDSMPKGHLLSYLPELVQPDTSHNTRETRIHRIYADQLLPILLFLAQAVGDGASVRQELEEGTNQAKELRAAYFKAMREETERWAAEKTVLTEEKDGGEKKEKTKQELDAWKIKFRKAERAHKEKVSDLQKSHKPEIDSCALRFTSLGCDVDGRTYYALSASGPQRGKKERLPSEGERLGMKKWGWLIAVYGKPGTVVQCEATDEDEDEDDPDEERWWGFADVEEMRKLSKWLAHRAEVEKKTEKDSKSESSAATTVTSSTLASRLASPSVTTAVSNPASRPLSSMSDVLAPNLEDGDNIMEVNGNEEARYETVLSQPATHTGVKALAKAILEFADFIDWRLKRDLHGTRNSASGIAAGKFYGD